MAKERIGFIGAGQMAEAIARGIIAAEMAEPARLSASDPDAARLELFREMGARAGEDNLAVVKEADTLIIAVKPQMLDELLRQIGPALREKQLIISICAGVPTALIEAASPRKLRVVRAMPNLPMRARMGATALCHGKNATARDMATAGKIFSAAGRAIEVKEDLMDAVTALSGSGPAYFYFLVEVMIEAGVQEGLNPTVARTLAIQTARGAAEMMVTEDLPPEELRRRVTSKGGTTEAAFKKMEEFKVREGLTAAIAAAAARARELGKR